MSKNNGFATGTLIHTEKGLVAIENIQVGDRVLAKPESGEGEPRYKTVRSTFKHEHQALWVLQAKRFHGPKLDGTETDSKDVNKYNVWSYLLLTPNHPVWVVGQGILDEYNNVSIDYTPYPQPHWKRVDQLEQYEMLVNHEGLLFSIDRVQPLYQFEPLDGSSIPLSKVAWYQHHHHITPEDEDYEDLNLERGGAIDVEKYHQGQSNYTDLRLIGDPWRYNKHFNSKDGGIPYTTTVYNFEVEEDHTYFVQNIGLWVQQ